MSESLLQVGYNRPDDVALVETTAPRISGWRTLLTQNAWHFISSEAFHRLSRPYPRSMRTRMKARRALAHVNVKRASRVIALTEYMATLVERSCRRNVDLSPVLVPLDANSEPINASARFRDCVVVPGTVTWFKNPGAALPICGGLDLDRVFFAGRDDGSGCLPALRAQAEERGIAMSHGRLSRSTMLSALSAATVVVVPSSLESLGLSLGESLLHARRVIASPIAPHVEVAAAMAGSPEWLGLPFEKPTNASIKGFDWIQEMSRWRDLADSLT